MQAVTIRQFGDPSQLRIEDVPTPEPSGTDILVAVKAAAINPSDVKNVAGVMHGITLPRIPGRDFAGVVVRGPADLLNREVYGTGGDIGFTRDGSHAEFILLPRDGIASKPASLSFQEAGNAGLTFVTAWSALVTAANIGPSDTALICGAAGGVGSAAVQIAKRRGAHVIGIVRSEKELALAREMGADEAINSQVTNVTNAVRSLTSNNGADVVFDTTGAMFAEAVELAATNARVPIITAPPDGRVTLNLRSVYRKTMRLIGVDSRPIDVVAGAKLLAEITPGFESGHYKVKPSDTFLLNRAVEAYEKASNGARIVLEPNS
jgi:NADPH:quinone reductase